MEHAIHRNSLDAHSKRAWCVAPLDDERVVSASDDNFVIVWKFRTKEPERRLFHEGATTVAVSHDRKFIVSAGRDCALRLWDANSGKLLSGPWQLHKDRVWSVTWSPDGGRIASCSADSNLIIWKWEAQSTSSSGESFLGPISTEQKAVHSVAYSPNGEKLATGGFDFTIKIWDAGTGSPQAILCGHTMSVSSVAWTKDGSRVISGSLDHTVRIWDIPKREEMHKIQAHAGAINYISVSDHVFATASYNKACLWNLKTHECLFESSQCDEMNCVALSDDENTIIACTEGGKVHTWNIEEITSVIKQNAEGNEVDNINATWITPYIENDSNVYNNFFSPSAGPSQGGVKPPAKKTQGAKTVKFIQRMVAPLRIPRNIVVSTAGRRDPPGPSVVEVALETETENYHNQRPVTAIRSRSPQSAPEQYSQTTTTLGPAQLSSSETPRERSGWFWATLRRLKSIFHDFPHKS